MSEDIDINWVKTIIKGIDGSEVLDVQTGPGVGKFENAASDIIRVDVVVRLKSDRIENKSYIYKKKRHGNTGDVLEEFDLFKFESMMYSKYLKEMELFSCKFDEIGFSQWPKCLGYKENAIIFENLKKSGYTTMEKRSSGMDWKHISLVIKTLSRFHALSAVMLDQGLINTDDFKPSLFISDIDIVTNMFKQGLNTLANSMNEYWGDEWNTPAEKLKSLGTDIGKSMKSLNEKVKGKFHVLNHGDGWTNNFMFKYDESGTPVDIMLIDFQICHINSFAWDLTYSIYNCLLPDDRKKSMEDILDLYHNCLTQDLKKYEYKGEIPSRQQIDESMNDLMLFGLFLSVSYGPLMMFCDRPDFEFDTDAFVSGNKETNIYAGQLKNYATPHFIKIMKREIEFFVNKGVL